MHVVQTTIPPSTDLDAAADVPWQLGLVPRPGRAADRAGAATRRATLALAGAALAVWVIDAALVVVLS